MEDDRTSVLSAASRRRGGIVFRRLNNLVGMTETDFTAWLNYRLPTPPGLVEKLQALLNLPQHRVDDILVDREPPKPGPVESPRVTTLRACCTKRHVSFEQLHEAVGIPEPIFTDWLEYRLLRAPRGLLDKLDALFNLTYAQAKALVAGRAYVLTREDKLRGHNDGQAKRQLFFTVERNE